jgi:hypothetical protein
MASGHVNRTKGRTHGCTDQPAGVKKVLANSEPSTHGASETNGDDARMSACRGKSGHRADSSKGPPLTRSGHPPERNPALQRDLITINALCCHEVPGWGSRCNSVN